MSTHMSTIELPPGSVIMARYMGQGDLQRWTLTRRSGPPVWFSGSTFCLWAALTDQQIPEPVTTDPTALPLDLDARQIADDALAVRTPGDGTDPVRVLAESYLEQVRLGNLRLERLLQLLAEVDRLRAPDVTTDLDGTDDSDEPLTTPYPPSDPNLWVRSPEDAAR